MSAGARILVVAESRTVRSQIESLCTRAGLNVRGVASLSAARAVLADEPVAVLVLDEWFEDGNGQDLIESIRGAGGDHLAIVSLAANATPGPWQPDARLAKLELGRLLIPELEAQLAAHAGETSLGDILIVDDSLTYREQLRASLEAAGYTVRMAVSGEEGVRMAFEQPPHAMLVDSMLPGIDGAAVIRRLRSESVTRRTPCCLLTASEDPAQELEALDAGADTFVRKDERMSVILARLAGILRSASTPAASSLAALPQLPRRVVLISPSRSPLDAAASELLEEGCETIALLPAEATPARCAQLEPDILLYTATVNEALLAFCRQCKSLPGLRNSRLLLIDLDGASGGTSAAEDAIQAGADDYLPPGSGYAVILARAKSQLRRKRMEDENRGLREHILRQELETEAQRALAEARSRHADEMRVAYGLAERKAQEAERARLELEQITEGIPQIVWTCGAGGAGARFNRRWKDYTGLSNMAVTHRLWRHVLHHEDRLRALRDWRRADREGQPYTSEYRLRSAGGEFRWFLVRAIPLDDEGGRLEGEHTARWFGTCTDVHDQKLSEEALRRTEKLAATGRLAASIAHEINNPLEAVTNLLYLMEMNTRGQGETHGYAVTAQKELDRVAQISKKTLAFYRENTNATEVDLCALVTEVAEIYAVRLERKRMTLQLEEDCGPKPQGLAGELRQVISNLVTNAIDASPEGTSIRVRVRAAKGGSDRGVPGVRITVADRGHGIPKTMQPDLFKPFITTKGAKGTGLGLWLSHSIVERHGGRIAVKSSTAGTCFSVFLPLALSVPRAQSDSMGVMLKTIGKELLGQ